jgi:hypothetical protein
MIQDIIGGTSTGGIVAICLARLRLSTTECLKIYGELSEHIFGQMRWFTLGGSLRSQFDARILEAKIKKALEDYEVNNDTEAQMLEPPNVEGDPKYHFCRW